MNPFRIALAAIVLTHAVAHSAEPVVDFRRDVAPILEQHCLRCHQPGNTKGEISLAKAGDLLADGHIVPRDPDASTLLPIVAPRANGQRARMPKDGAQLTAAQRDTLRQWIVSGADWPAEVVLQERAKADKSWWSLQPLSHPAIPQPQGIPAAWQANPIDRFIYAKLSDKGLSPNPPADPIALGRRLAYDLTGLPPTPERLAQFVRDPSPAAYEAWVDELLASSAYGEHWGRHWLDVVRFGESNGFERNVLIDGMWPFRDYVIRSFNEDKPYTQLVREHLAGDVIAPTDPKVAVGTTFLVAGPYDDVGNQDAAQAAIIRANTIDDMVRATAESFLGVTVGCARCHNHKFDPITQLDYHRLNATFAGVRHGKRLIATPEIQAARNQQVAAINARRTPIVAKRDQLRAAITARANSNAKERETKWVRPAADPRQTTETFDPTPARHIRLTVLGRNDNPAIVNAFVIDEFEVWSGGSKSRNVALQANGATASGPSRQAEDFADAYSPMLTIDGQYGAGWISAGGTLTITLAQPETISRIDFSALRGPLDKPERFKRAFVSDYEIDVSMDGKTWKRIADSSDRKAATPAVRNHRLFHAEVTAEEQKQLDAWALEITQFDAELAALPAPPTWWVGTFEAANGPFHIFTGGDPQKKAEVVPFNSLRVLSDAMKGYELPSNTSEGQRRLALANWLIADDNPLTPRVLANRIWHYHFGTGIVSTTSDFGAMGSAPSHPELLDYLADQLHRDGWKWKPMHKRIVMSHTYRQSSAHRADAAAVDADSRLLWRFPPRRLAAEEVRDSMLAVAGNLDRRAGGPGFRLYRYLQDNVSTYVPLDAPGPDTYRRAVYHQNARAARVDVLTDFDCPDPAFASPRRASTTTPLQALTLFNHRFTFDMAQALADRLEQESPVDDRAAQVRRAFAILTGRTPAQAEVDACLTVIKTHGLRAFCRAMLNSNEFLYLD